MIIDFGLRLRAARKMAGMSMAALAEKTGAVVTKQAISKYEKGLMKPSSEVLIALSQALGIKVDYFFRSSDMTIAGLEFRKKSKLTKRAENQIKYRTIDFLQKYLELEKLLNIHFKFSNPVSENIIKDYEDIERAAQLIRKKWNLGQGPVPNLIELLEDKGFKIYEVDEFEHFDGLSGFVSDLELPVIAVYKKGDLVRKRFTVAHELGHLLLDFSGADHHSKEKLCHAFAGALLLPREILEEELGRRRSKITEWELKRLKGIFGISMQAIMARAVSIGIINENYYRAFCVYANKHGWRRKEPGKYEGQEVANRFKQLVYHALAEGIISYGKAAEYLNKSVSSLMREVHVVS